MKYAISKTLRSTIVQLSHRVRTVSVHNMLPPQLSVPAHVLCYLNKGAKFIPDHHRSTLDSVLRSMGRRHSQLTVAAHFKHSAKERKRHKCHVRDPFWRPGRNDHVDIYIRLLKTELLNYRPFSFRPNTNWADRKAKQWLKEHSHDIVVIDCDKNMGDAAIAWEWVDSKMDQLISEGCEPVEEQVYLDKTEGFQRGLDVLTLKACENRLITQGEKRHLTQGYDNIRAGSFR
mmetsp:Transcript_59513/g.169247  ORF Transcript_59513/g.169247 Transcript_59513/m.169247 type:complete len:231 (+) Transcript_59513:400-1092(+)